MKKRIFALAMALAMAATAAGCGAKQSTDVEALLQKANDTMAQVTSMSAQMEVQMDMAFEEESMKSVVKSDMDLKLDPFKTNMTISMTLNDEALQTYEMYAVQNGDTVDAYMQVDGEWIHQPMASADVSQYNAGQNMDLYLKNIEAFKVTGTEEINGNKTTVIEGLLTGDAMEEALKNSGIESTTAGLGISADDLVTLMDSVEGMPVKLWISDDGYVMQYELDMTAMMQGIMDVMSGGEENPVTISKTLVHMTLTQYLTLKYLRKHWQQHKNELEAERPKATSS